MTRDQAIAKLLQNVSKASLASVIATKSTQKPFDFTLLAANALITSTTTDPKNNWFTTFAVLVIYQRGLSGEIIQLARTADGKPHLKLKQKIELLDAISAGAKLTKADAG
jgi:hypothetical protein